MVALFECLVGGARTETKRHLLVVAIGAAGQFEIKSNRPGSSEHDPNQHCYNPIPEDRRHSPVVGQDGANSREGQVEQNKTTQLEPASMSLCVQAEPGYSGVVNRPMQYAGSTSTM